MNCKPGDLALLKSGGIAGGEAFNDRLVEVIDSAGVDGFYGQMWSVKCAGWTPAPHLVALSRRGTFYYPDSMMRPIRDQPGEDETLAWAGKPAESPADVIREVTA